MWSSSNWNSSIKYYLYSNALQIRMRKMKKSVFSPSLSNHFTLKRAEHLYIYRPIACIDPTGGNEKKYYCCVQTNGDGKLFSFSGLKSSGLGRYQFVCLG